MAFKRYIHKHGKKLGPYYYENVRTEGKVKTVYLGTNPQHHPRHRIKKPLFFLILVLVLILLLGGSLFLLQNRSYLIKKVTAQEPDFEIDQILLKVLIRSNEFIEKQVRIMNIAGNPIGIDMIASGLGDIVKIDSSSFTIKPGQTKIVTLSFLSVIPEQNIEQQPGIYVGKLVAKSEKAAKEVPIVVEIETKNVLFDMNLNPVAIERRVKQGSDTTIEVRLFNLESIESVNVDVEYFVKDMNGNTIITESETVVVKTQASFFKTISIPKNLKPGSYVFAAIARFGNSIGTSSYLFEVIGPETEASFVQFCKNSVLCLGLSLATILLLFALIAYFYFFIGAYLYEKVTGVVTIPKKGAEGVEAKEKPGIFERLNARLGRWKKAREAKKAEKEMLEKEEELNLIEYERKKELESKRKSLEGRKKSLEELKRQEQSKKQEALEARRQAEEQRRKKIKELFHKVGLFRTPEEKKQIALQKEQEKQERLEAGVRLKKQKELEARKTEQEKERKRLEEEKRKAEDKKRGELESRRIEEEKQRQRLEEEKKKEEEKKLKDQIERQKELERQKALESKKKLYEENKRKEEQLQKQKDAEKQKRELEKSQKLAAIKQLEERLTKNREVSEQLRAELRKIESEKRVLSSSNNETEAKIRKVDHDILEKSRHSEELSLQKSSFFEHYKKRLDELAKSQESRKAAKEEEIKNLKAKLAARQEAIIKELEDELSKLTPQKRKTTEKWKRLEIKAKLKIEEQNIEEQIKKEEESDGKQAIDDNYKKSIEEIGKKQNALKNEIAQLERQKQGILLEKKNVPRELALKENELQKILSRLEENAGEKEALSAELSKLRAELSKFSLHFIKSLVSGYKEKAEKARKEKEEERARLEAQKRKEEEITRKEKELAEKTKNLEEERKRKEEGRKAREEQKRKALEEKLRIKEEQRKQKELERQKAVEKKQKKEVKLERHEEFKLEKELEEEKKPGLFAGFFKKQPEIKEKAEEPVEKEKPEPEIGQEAKQGFFKRFFAKPKKIEELEIEAKEVLEEEKPKAKKTEAEELEEAIRGLDLFKQVAEKGKVQTKEREKPKLLDKFIKKKAAKAKEAEKPIGEVSASLPEKEEERAKVKEKPAKKSIFGKLFGKAEKVRDVGEPSSQLPEIERKAKPVRVYKTKKLEKFYKILDGAQSSLGKNDLQRAKKLYLEAREDYIKLDYNEKKEVYD
ncbi:hypothetical protein HYX07_00495, partial [Candidatus Woesearchaeota archaeon]|nr:hypothetical protein [Candidatus Woesearchaeota archaeon]